jgi:hypothetical protein
MLARSAFFLLFAVAACNGAAGKPSGPVPTDPGTTPPVPTQVTTPTTPPTTDTVADCGGCPSGTTCRTANGIPVCRDDDTGIPRFEHVFVILMENTSTETLVTSDSVPYLRDLVAQYAFSLDYHGIEHPSLANYIVLFSGSYVDNGPKECDCDPLGGACNQITCNTLLSSCGCPQDQTNLGDQLEAAGVSWRMYAEGMGDPCTLESSGDYAVKHVPALYFPSLTDDRPRCEDHVVDYTEFPGDLAAGPRQFVFLTPDLVHDMHDPVPAGEQNLRNGDDWLAEQVPHILASTAYTDRGALIIVWDEDDSELIEFNPSDDPIPMILMSPLAKQGGYASGIHADHDNLLAMIEDGLGVGRLGNAVGEDPLTDFFPEN